MDSLFTSLIYLFFTITLQDSLGWEHITGPKIIQQASIAELVFKLGLPDPSLHLFRRNRCSGDIESRDMFERKKSSSGQPLNRTLNWTKPKGSHLNHAGPMSLVLLSPSYGQRKEWDHLRRDNVWQPFNSSISFPLAFKQGRTKPSGLMVHFITVG